MSRFLFVMADPLEVDFSSNKVICHHLQKTLAAKIENFSDKTIDLYQSLPPYFDQQSFQHLWLNAGPDTNDKVQTASRDGANSVTYIEHHCSILKQYDHLVISAPVWNYFVPAILKAWLDLIISPGYSYEFTEQGIRPLHHLESVTMILSAGGDLSRHETDKAILKLLQDAFHFLQISQFHSLVVDRQEASLYPEHEQMIEKVLLQSEHLVSRYFIPVCN